MNTRLRFLLMILTICMFSLFVSSSAPAVFGQSQQSENCRDSLAKAANALFCERYTQGYLKFVDSFQPPNQYWEIRGDIEVIVFDSYVVASKGQLHFIVPRDRVIYLGSIEIK